VAIYIFETITDAEALAFDRDDRLVLTTRAGQSASVTFRGDMVLFDYGGRSVLFHAAAFQAASAAGHIEFENFV
jgi:hypothetical protein